MLDGSPSVVSGLSAPGARSLRNWLRGVGVHRTSTGLVAGRVETWNLAVTGACDSGGVHVSRIGFTARKGARHVGRSFVDLTRDGPVGDRVFCLVDPARERVLRSVENPTLVQTRARWDAGVLRVSLPGATVEGVPALTGETRTLDYWGRRGASRSSMGRGRRRIPLTWATTWCWPGPPGAGSSTAPVSAWSPPARSTSSPAGRHCGARRATARDVHRAHRRTASRGRLDRSETHPRWGRGRGPECHSTLPRDRPRPRHRASAHPSDEDAGGLSPAGQRRRVRRGRRCDEAGSRPRR